MTERNCRICEFSTTSPMGMMSHSRSHRNRFQEIVGRAPENYDEVVALLRDGETPDDYTGDTGSPTKLSEYANE